MSIFPRPKRPVLPDFRGKAVTLGDSPENWFKIAPGHDMLLLGLGPGDPALLPFVSAAAERGARIFWHEMPRNLRQLAEQGVDPARIPKTWIRLNARDAILAAPGCAIYFYRPGLRLAPEYWGKMLGSIRAIQLAGWRTPYKNAPAQVILPGHAGQLLHQELELAISQSGCQPGAQFLQGESERLKEYLANLASSGLGRPLMLLSVNLRGLDGSGEVFYLCRSLQIPVAVWFVDNPWHILSSLRLPWWKKTAIFVTDPSFMASLAAEGAQNVFFLPLAVSQHMWRKFPAKVGGMAPPLFVGRSSFPGKSAFFSAAHINEAIWSDARRKLTRSTGPADAPNFHWWMRKLGLKAWPGHEVRCAGLGAEEMSCQNRARWLAAGCAGGLEVVGDSGWERLVPHCRLMPPVDYYHGLGELYGAAACVLNVTSLLLPGSLSQRHFDVWAAGGFLLSDGTAGLDIFPSELVSPIVVDGPGVLLEALHNMGARQHWRQELIMAWRAELMARHSYAHRLATMTHALEVDWPHRPADF